VGDGLRLPAAVFLDFGGVLTDVQRRDDGFRETAETVVALLRRASCTSLDRRAVERDLRAGAAAHEAWKRSQSRAPAPLEIAGADFWEQFVTGDWPPAARALVSAAAPALCDAFEAATVARPAKAGAGALLDALASRGIRTALICNTISGHGTRRLLREHGFADRLGVEVYSDELGRRKPNPAVFAPALAGLAVAPADVWYVGDKYDRDVLAARRAHLGAAILMESAATDPAQRWGPAPDAVVRSPAELETLLEASAAVRG
jgi:N-acetyl-D-muramate 6-phosphate phosphatase